jgi:hypothetical protein
LEKQKLARRQATMTSTAVSYCYFGFARAEFKIKENLPKLGYNNGRPRPLLLTGSLARNARARRRGFMRPCPLPSCAKSLLPVHLPDEQLLIRPSCSQTNKIYFTKTNQLVPPQPRVGHPPTVCMNSLISNFPRPIEARHEKIAFHVPHPIGRRETTAAAGEGKKAMQETGLLPHPAGFG